MKKLILIRHGHRDKSVGYHKDNGLDEKGKIQADEFLKFYQKNYSKITPKLISSPKLRCVETLEPLAEKFQVKIVIDELLLEQGLHEGPEMFLDRIQKFLTELKKETSEVVILCSHGDWLPIAFWTCTGKADSFKKGSWKEVKID
jgi:8-oxo-dGTP diphosphatase